MEHRIVGLEILKQRPVFSLPDSPRIFRVKKKALYFQGL